MLFIIPFLLFLTALAAVFVKTREIEAFVSAASFITGITQMLLLFLFFLAVFTGVKSSEFTVNSEKMLLMYMFDFMTIPTYLIFLFIKSRRIQLTLKKSEAVKELVQLFLPVLILDLSIRILAKYGLGEHSYVYMKISNQYLFALFFKFIFAFAGFFLVKNLNTVSKREQ
ncbi:MAG: hypothetical protein AB7T10_05445 [bacterium]